MHEQNVWYLICFEKIYHKLLLELLSINLCFWCDSFTVLLCIRVCLSLPDKLFISSTLHSSWQKRKEEWFFTNQRNYLFRFCDHDLPFIKLNLFRYVMLITEAVHGVKVIALAFFKIKYENIYVALHRWWFVFQ